MHARQWPVVTLLGVAQSLSWASTYYVPAVFGEVIAADTGLSKSGFFAIVTAALVLSALLGPFVGTLIDRHGGRWILASSVFPSSSGLLLLSLAESPCGVVAAWICIGFGMGLGLYEAAAATLAGVFGNNARRAIASFTLAAGFASSFGWLVGSYWLETFGWRIACLNWATVQYLLILPLYLLLPNSKPNRTLPFEGTSGTANSYMIAFAVGFSLCAVVGSGLAAHLPALLELRGLGRHEAIVLSSLIGPAQVAARAAEILLLQGQAPLLLARNATLFHPLGAALLLSGAPYAAAFFPLLHGSSFALLTTARSTVPLTIFGPNGFGRRFGAMSMSIRIVSATGPLLFAILIDATGTGVLAVSACFCLAAGVIFWASGRKFKQVATPR